MSDITRAMSGKHLSAYYGYEGLDRMALEFIGEIYPEVIPELKAYFQRLDSKLCKCPNCYRTNKIENTCLCLTNPSIDDPDMDE